VKGYPVPPSLKGLLESSEYNVSEDSEGTETDTNQEGGVQSEQD